MEACCMPLHVCRYGAWRGGHSGGSTPHGMHNGEMRQHNVHDSFIWATGIEDSFVPQTRGKFRRLDEYELIGHYDHWREDLALVRDAGLGAVRWGVPWYRVEPEDGRFDWSWTDQVIPYVVEELGVTPIIDLIHYGCPHWMPRAF